VRFACKKDIGRVRDNIEDEYLVDEEIGLFLVADGLGGHRAGEVASRLGAETIHGFLKAHPVTDNSTINQLIKKAVDNAHEVILNRAFNNSNLRGMGTTVVLALCRGDRLYIAHVGDSRAYLINSEGIKLLTEDHSLVHRLLKTGEITREEARTHSQRHVITQCLGSDGYFGPDINTYGWTPGDFLLLCSDGLTDMVDDKTIKKVVLENKNDIQHGADELVKLANEGGGRDNIAVLIVLSE